MRPNSGAGKRHQRAKGVILVGSYEFYRGWSRKKLQMTWFGVYEVGPSLSSSLASEAVGFERKRDLRGRPEVHDVRGKAPEFRILKIA